MDEQELFKIKVFQARKPNEEDQPSDGNIPHYFAKFQNMTSARIIKGRLLELEHSNLAGPAVKFKTVVNYERTLDPGSYLGVSFAPQEGYIS